MIYLPFLLIKLIAIVTRSVFTVLPELIRINTWPLRRLGQYLTGRLIKDLASIILLAVPVALVILTLVWYDRLQSWATENPVIAIYWGVAVALAVAPNVIVATYIGARGVVRCVTRATRFGWRGATQKCPVHHSSHRGGLGAGNFIVQDDHSIVELCDNQACEQCLVVSGYGTYPQRHQVRDYGLSRVQAVHSAPAVNEGTVPPAMLI